MKFSIFGYLAALALIHTSAALASTGEALNDLKEVSCEARMQNAPEEFDPPVALTETYRDFVGNHGYKGSVPMNGGANAQIVVILGKETLMLDNNPNFRFWGLARVLVSVTSNSGKPIASMSAGPTVVAPKGSYQNTAVTLAVSNDASVWISCYKN